MKNDNRSDEGKTGDQNGGGSDLQTGRIIRVELKDVVSGTGRSAAATSTSGSGCCASLVSLFRVSVRFVSEFRKRAENANSEWCEMRKNIFFQLERERGSDVYDVDGISFIQMYQGSMFLMPITSNKKIATPNHTTWPSGNRFYSIWLVHPL